jgi:hypothetical protein
MKKIMILFVIVVLIILFLLICVNQKQNRRSQSIYVKINDLRLKIQIADNLKKKFLGLSGQKKMPEQEGMLFVFNQPGSHSFWMRGMKFPLDIIWINKDLEIIEIKKDIQPDSFPQIYKSIDPAKYVLEINAGLSDQYNIKEGDRCFLENYLDD